jgi:hypothetical protein
LIRSLRYNEIVTERPKILSSLEKFGALVEYPALHKAFPRSQCFDKTLLRFGAALWAALKRHQSAVGVNYVLQRENILALPV